MYKLLALHTQAGSRIAPVITVNAFLALQVRYRVVRWATDVWHQYHFLIKQVVISLTDKADRYGRHYLDTKSGQRRSRAMASVALPRLAGHARDTAHVDPNSRQGQAGACTIPQ
jgi:hypothetical protein